MVKICTKCHTEKDLSDFYPKAGHPGKLLSWCKVCTSDRTFRKSPRKPKTEEQKARDRERSRQRPKVVPMEKVCPVCLGRYTRKFFRIYCSQKCGTAASHWRQEYNLQPHEVHAMYDDQHGVCGVEGCGTTLLRPPHRETHIHHLEIGEERIVCGLLCRSCNFAEGWIRSRGHLLIPYVEMWNERLGAQISCS